MESKNNWITLILFVSGMTQRSVKAIRIVREICDRELERYKLTVVDIFRESQAPDQAWPVVPILIGNLPIPLIARIKKAAREQNFFLPVIRAQFIQVDEWRGKGNVQKPETKSTSS